MRGQMHMHCNFTTCHPSCPSLPHHPFLVLGLLVVSHLVLLRLVTILGICMYISRVRRGRDRIVLHSGSRLGDYDAISITCTRNERCKTTILVGTTSAFRALGELDGQLLRTLARRILEIRVSTRVRSTMDSVYIFTVGNSCNPKSCFLFHLGPPSPT